jgi:hypothetical protein
MVKGEYHDAHAQRPLDVGPIRRDAQDGRWFRIHAGERDTQRRRDAVSSFRDIARPISGRYWTLVHCRVPPGRATVPSAILDCAAAFDRMSVVDSARGISAYHNVSVDRDASVLSAALLGDLIDALEFDATHR